MAPPTSPGDREALRALLAIEELEAALYREALVRVPDLTPGARALVERLAADEGAHAAGLRATLRERGGAPTPGPPLPPPRPLRFEGVFASARAFLAEAQRIEDVAVGALHDAVPRLAAPELRVAVASIAAVDARHSALVRSARGRPPGPSALEPTLSATAVDEALARYRPR